ncbi:MAG: hypothetical protein AVDCRST_MAG16-2192, partial [uncultured Frankineae bacterium]
GPRSSANAVRAGVPDDARPRRDQGRAARAHPPAGARGAAGAAAVRGRDAAGLPLPHRPHPCGLRGPGGGRRAGAPARARSPGVAGPGRHGGRAGRGRPAGRRVGGGPARRLPRGLRRDRPARPRLRGRGPLLLVRRQLRPRGGPGLRAPARPV